MAAAKTPGFAPDKFEIEDKGPRMKALYAVTGKEREFVCSFFSDEKADYVIAAILKANSTKTTRKRNTASEVTAKAAKKPAAKAAPTKKTRVVRKKV